jgi:hypothetical protein
MKHVISIGIGVISSDALQDELQREYPRAFAAFRWDYSFLPEEDTEVIALRDLLRRAGIRETDVGGYVSGGRTVTVVRRRLFDHDDLRHAPAMLINVLGEPVFKSVQHPLAPIFGDDFSKGHNQRVWMLNTLIEDMKVHTWSGVTFLPAQRTDSRHGTKAFAVWEHARELSSAVVLPPVAFGPLKHKWEEGQPVTRDVIRDITGMHDEGFRDFVPRFYAKDWERVSDWDIALSYEQIMGERNRYIYVSQRVYKMFRALDLDHLCDWKPCEIIEGERPKSA